MPAAGRVLVVGSINTDLVAYVERLPEPGETVGGARFSETAGGKGANQAVAAARSGASCVLHGAVGDDAYGTVRVDNLAAAGVATDHVAVLPEERSGVALIYVDARGENQIAVAPGANGAFRLDAEAFCAGVGPNDVVLLQNEIDPSVTTAAIALARERRAAVMWNIAPALTSVGEAEQAAIAQVDYLIVNAGELEALMARRSGESAAEMARRAVDELGCSQVLLTLGAEGAVMADVHDVHRQAAVPVQAVDTVGAGDCFAGVFAASVATGREPLSALRRAVAAAGVCVTREGAQRAMPSGKEIDRAVGFSPTSVGRVLAPLRRDDDLLEEMLDDATD
ncbi:MAG: ribokinase [Spirochaetaceae bacterium]|nr:ribokinase [Spirochaetaceae bacterium]